MDESLSDFQEKKKNCTGPKNVPKPKINHVKKRKRIKGQGDIRTLVRAKKNELVTYTKDFDLMCKKSRIDIDSEQLQLAIALSKSLHDSENLTDVETETAKPLSAIERSRKIKSTLKEYGFKVPNCVLKKPNKKITNKKYKLLITPDIQKHKLIYNKYIEVLQRNPTPKILSTFNNSDTDIYYKATNISYNKIKNIEEFYIPNLIEKSVNKTCLLKDWSEIPGRPVSPDLRVSNFNFDEFEFTQDELDCILSNSLQCAQEIVKRRSLINFNEQTLQETVEGDMNTEINSELYNNNCNKELASERLTRNTNMYESQRALSASPDLFEDDECSFLESNHDQSQKLQKETHIITKDKFSFMDLTECVGNVSNRQQNIMQLQEHKLASISPLACLGSNSCIQDEKDELVTNRNKPNEHAHQMEDNLTDNSFYTNNPLETKLSSETVRKINDFMEITECVDSGFNQQNMANINHTFKNNDNSLLQSLSIKEMNTKKCGDVQSERCFSNHTLNEHNIENIDLTQTSVESDNSLKETVVPAKEYVDDIDRLHKNKIETISMDLTQSSNSNEDLPIVQLSGTKPNVSSDDTILIYDNESTYNVSTKKIKMVDTNTSEEIIECLTEDASNDRNSQHENCTDMMPSSEDNIVIFSDNEDEKNNVSALVSEDTIDLTQSPKLSILTYHSNDSLGKQNNVSIDYDELYDIIASTAGSPGKRTEIIGEVCKMKVSDGKNLNFDDESVQSLQTSLLKSPELCNEDYFDHISIVDRLPNEDDVERQSIIAVNNSYLPNVEVKTMTTKVNRKSANLQFSPCKLSSSHNKSTVQTPVNKEYIVKTDNVTPILDYESMTTPARNKELEKYGIKPFKRKRAIQLLTYLYNQTHPVVEQCLIDEMPTTSKRLKVDVETKKSATSPKQQSCEEMDIDKENSLYRETKKLPDIKEIVCCPEDWVFQTREKAKVHSCRVPLHIVLHNYVSCRSMLRAAILRYEPINIDVVHKDLIASGYRYNPKELLKFMDKKCITVKTAENKLRNKKS